MGGVFQDYLPFLDGWQYAQYNLEGVLERGKEKQIVIPQSGWLGEVILISTDSYANLKIEPQNRRLTLPVNISPEYLKTLSVTNPQSGGFLQQYKKFNPQSTFGSFLVILSQDPLPFVSSTRVTISLLPSSTQTSAFISAKAILIELTDKTQFLESLGKLPGFKSTDLTLVEAMKNLTHEIKALRVKQ